MTEHLHDPDLILSLAAGPAPLGSESPAVAALLACERCSTDLTMQQKALEALSNLSPARLEPAERDRLHGNLRTALGLDVPVAAAPTPTVARRRWRPMWGLATAAAVFLAIVVVPPAFRALSPSDEAGDLFTAAAESTTTAAGADALADEAESARVATAPSGDNATAGSGDDGAATLGGAQTETFGVQIALPFVDLAPPGNLAAEQKAVEQTGAIAPDDTGQTVMVATDTIALCRAGVPGGQDGYPVAATEIDGLTALLMAYPDTSGVRLVAHALSDCAILETTGG